MCNLLKLGFTIFCVCEPNKDLHNNGTRTVYIYYSFASCFGEHFTNEVGSMVEMGQKYLKYFKTKEPLINP